jgi:hypothetical protein
VAVVLAALCLGGWEFHWRNHGYAPTLEDTGDLWAETRSRLGPDPDQTVIIGSSRILFDFDLQAYAKAFGTALPVQLALPGGTPAPILYHIAEETPFRGTLLVGVTPPLYFVPGGFPVERAESAIHRYKNWSPSQRLGNILGKALQKQVAFFNEDLTLDALLKSLPVPNREGAARNLPPRFPPYFGRVEEGRQVWMWEKCGFGTPLAARIQNIWKPLFTPPPPPPEVTPEEAKERFLAAMEATLERTRRSVETIRGRGGRVVFIRPPSSGWVRDMENTTAPRAGFWDRILAVSGSPGIHFEDYPALSDFACPEWSHLTAGDAVRYSRAVLPILKSVLSEDAEKGAG